MNRSRFSFSLAVTSSIALAAIILPIPANAQLYSRGGRIGSNAVANHADSLPTVASSGGPSTSDSSASSPEPKPSASASAEKGAGLSGKVFARFVLPEDWISMASIPGASLASASVQSSATPSSETVFTMRAFGQKVRQWLNGYRLGYWPQEKGRLRSEAYKNPDGFIEVTPENEDTRVSEHFRLRDFVSHGQKDVWPKYVFFASRCSTSWSS